MGRKQRGATSGPRHLPSPEEIQAACLEIRLTWPAWDELRRRQAEPYRPVEVTRCRVCESVREPRE